jgi:hypothetical protein
VLTACLCGCGREATKPAAGHTAAAESLQSGEWAYHVTVTQPGTRSEGRLGELFHKGAPVPKPAAINASVETPWGPLYWHGRGDADGLRLWDDQGWMRAPRKK